MWCGSVSEPSPLQEDSICWPVTTPSVPFRGRTKLCTIDQTWLFCSASRRTARPCGTCFPHPPPSSCFLVRTKTHTHIAWIHPPDYFRALGPISVPSFHRLHYVIVNPAPTIDHRPHAPDFLRSAPLSLLIAAAEAREQKGGMRLHYWWARCFFGHGVRFFVVVFGAVGVVIPIVAVCAHHVGLCGECILAVRASGR